MKTYSVTFRSARHGEWVTNWGQYFSLDEIDWEKVHDSAVERGDLAYGYYYGYNSRNLTSDRCRTVLWERNGK